MRYGWFFGTNFQAVPLMTMMTGVPSPRWADVKMKTLLCCRPILSPPFCDDQIPRAWVLPVTNAMVTINSAAISEA